MVAPGDELQITLTNALPVPTSIVILGQVGGGLGTPVKMGSPTHITQTQTTWPGNVGSPDTTAFVPPAQLDRVKSFGTEVANGTTSASPLVWTGLKPGTYIYETGTLPSIQAPMGLYGVLIVTQAPVAADPVAVTAFAAGNAYPNNPTPIAYDSDVSLLFSEVDAVQNRAVDAAAVALADINKRFDDVSCSTATPCYPAAVNYTPTYFLINGHAYDATTPLNSAFAVAGNSVAPGAASVGGKILVRLLNAGLRTHVPSIVGMPVTIVAEDGNVAPGNAKVQNEVLLTAGKTHDVLITAPSAIGAYSASTFSVFDRQLSLTSGNAPDGGMQGFLQVAGGTLPTAVGPTLVNDAFKVPYNTPISGNVKLNDIGVAAVLPGTSPLHGSLVLNSDGTFVYTPTTNYFGADSFTYGASNTGAQSAKVSLTTASVAAGTLTAVADSYDSTLLSRFSASRPGVLANDTDSNGYSLSATSAVNGSGGSACGSVVLNTDGSFTATKGSGNSCSFTYVARNMQGRTSATAKVTVNFLKAGLQAGLKVRVFDPASNADISDYRWIIQEDLTFKVDPTGTPSLSTRTLGTSFHKSYMPIVATGCVGPVSCGSGNQSRTDNTTVDPTTGTLGARHILTDTEALALQAMPDQAVLDPTKHYYISILPGDAAGDAAGNSGHGMGGTEIKPGDVTASATTPISIAANAYDWTPAQLSIYIYEDNAPLNGQNDQDEPGLGGFNIILMDAVGRSGDVAGQQTYDAGGHAAQQRAARQAWLPGRPEYKHQRSITHRWDRG